MSIYDMDKSTPESNMGVLKKFTLFKNSEEIYEPIGKELFMQLNLDNMTFSYGKFSDPDFSRIFGYKQVYKYSLKLSDEERNLGEEFYKTGFKLFLENRVFVLFCQTPTEFRNWIQSFKSFFDKKFVCIMNSNKNINNDVEYASEMKNKNDDLNDSVNISLNPKKDVREFHRHKIKDITPLKIFFESMLTNHFHTFTNKIHKIFMTGLNELQKYFIENQKLKSMTKKKSDMVGKKPEQEELYARGDFDNNFQKEKKNFLEIKIIDNIYNTEGEDEDFENMKNTQPNFEKKIISRNNSDYRAQSPIKILQTVTFFKTFPTKQKSPVKPEQINQSINYLQDTNEKQLSNRKKKSESKDQKEIVDLTLDKKVNKKRDINSNEIETTIIRDAKKTTNDGMNKHASFSDLSTSLAPSETGISEKYSNRFIDDKFTNKKEMAVSTPRNESKMSIDKENVNDNYSVPWLRFANERENFQMEEKKRQKSPKSNNDFRRSENDLFQQSENSPKVNNRNEPKNNPLWQSLDFVPLDRKNLKQQEKVMNNMNLSNEENFTKKVTTVNHEIIKTPHYGTVSFIAQRFEKIDIDQWRVDD